MVRETYAGIGALEAPWIADVRRTPFTPLQIIAALKVKPHNHS